MNGKQAKICAVCLLGLAFGVGLETVHGQKAAPTENKGITAKPLATIDLGPEIEGMGGRQLRMRLVVIEPGGVLGLHSHKDRPATDYMLRGSVVDHRGDAAKEYGPGEPIFETKEVVHWLENKGTVPAEFVTVDIFKQP